MFKEKKLVYFSDDTSGEAKPEGKVNAKPETKSEKDAREREEYKKKVQDLKVKLEKSDLDKATKLLAGKILSSNEKDEIKLVEDLIDGKLTQEEFNEQIADIRAKKSGKKNPDELKNSIAARTKKTARLNNITPENKAQAELLSKSQKELAKLNKAELKVKEDVLKLLEPLTSSNSISSEKATKISALDPSHPDFDNELKLLMGKAYSENPKIVAEIRRKKDEQVDIIKKFEVVWDKVCDLVEQIADDFEESRNQSLLLRRLKKLSGINLREGLLLEYIALGRNNKREVHTTEIQKIEFKLPPTDPADKEEENELLAQGKEVYITITDNIGGVPIERELNFKEFVNWVNQAQVIEVVTDITNLESKLTLDEYGQKITTGLTLDYIASKNSTTGKLNYEKVTIDGIDHESRKIKLSKPVVVSAYNEDEEHVEQKYKSELTFAEFVRWYNKSSAEESMNVERAQQLLNSMPYVYKTRYPDVDPMLWDFKDEPIDLKVGEKITWGQGSEAEIKSVNNDEVVLSNGASFTPGQFIRFVKDVEAEKKEVVPNQEKIHDKLLDALEAEAAKNPDAATIANSPLMKEPGQGFLSSLWANYNFLSLYDFQKMFETVQEFFKRKLERNSKRRAAIAGKKLPGRLGFEFQSLAQSSENEEVDKIYNELKQQDVWDIRDAMVRYADNTDYVKACINLLTEKGSFDVEDPVIWKAMNKVFMSAVSQEEYEANKIDLNGGINSAGRKTFDAILYIMDGIWGKPGGKNWLDANRSAYESEMSKAMAEAPDLENDPAGVQGALHNMLVQHKRGEYVPPFKYEGYLRFIIEAGKGEPEDKMMYLIGGLVTPNGKERHEGEFLLSKKRIASIESKYLNNLPHLDFFTRYKSVGDDEIIKRESMAKIFDRFECDFTVNAKQRYNVQAVRDFIWQDVMTHTAVLNRMDKAARAANAMDHDDAHILIPMVDEQNMKQHIISNTQGQRSTFTAPGLANGVAGFAHYLRTLTEVSMKGNADHERRSKENFVDHTTLLQKMFKAWLVFESSVMGRVKYGNYASLASYQKNKSPLVDGSNTVQGFADEVREVLRDVLKAYGVSGQQIAVFLDAETGDKNKEKNEIHKQEMSKFGQFFDNLLASQGTEKMIAVVQNAKNTGRIRGFTGSAAPKKSKEEREEEDLQNAKNAETNASVELIDPSLIIGSTKQAANKTTTASNTSNEDDPDGEGSSNA